MDIPIKFMIGWLIIMSVTYSLAGYVYTRTYETPELDTSEQPTGLLDVGGAIIDWFINAIVMLFRVFFFALPNMPAIVIVILNVIFIPLNFAWFLGIYPFLRDVARLIIEGLDAIIPF